ncbi:MAG: aldo/keto reductase [Marinifilaceae bacterium]|jgi:alcohol dehydrogenase (NADP+)|nr:aldo/keto reductase [Marinifilaceae bacterium]
MKHLELNKGSKFPLLGLGTWKSEPGEVANAVIEAVKIGYRHIDCAAIYGNEKEIGEALNNLFQDGIVKREDLFITSKLWNDKHGEENVIPALQKSLEDLQLEYLDLYLIHWPVPMKTNSAGDKSDDYYTEEEMPISTTWKAMEKSVEMGLVKNIGVSNFGIKKLQKLIDNSVIKPAVNQVELNPYFQQLELFEFCNENNIALTAYSPLGSNDRPANLKKADEPILLEDESLKLIADEKDCSVAQLILAWVQERGISVIPKSVNPTRLRQNFESSDIDLTTEDLLKIKAVNKDRRFVDGAFWVVDDGPHTIQNLWE